MVIKSCPLLMKDTETCVGSSLASYFVLFSFYFVFISLISFRFVSFLFRFALYRCPSDISFNVSNLFFRAFILSSVVFTFLDASIVIDLILILAMSHHSLKFEKDFFSNFQYTHQFVNTCQK